jgi:hypothetical protein
LIVKASVPFESKKDVWYREPRRYRIGLVDIGSSTTL